MQAMPDITNDSIRAGPVLSWAATPVRTKMPVPMMAPTPRLVSAAGPSTRRSRCSPAISFMSVSYDLVAKSGLAIWPPRVGRASPARGLEAYHTDDPRSDENVREPAGPDGA